MRVAVVGAGFFGSTSAIFLGRAGHDVDIYDLGQDILTQASRTNQLRLHRGYHYPRSEKTAEQVERSIPDFVEEFGESCLKRPRRSLYCIPHDGSLTSPPQFEDFCTRMNLPLEKITRSTAVVMKSVQAVYEVDEVLIDFVRMRHVISSKLDESHVVRKMSTKFGKSMGDSYDLVVNATYRNLNDVTSGPPKDYQFELCEKIMVTPPKVLRDVSVVVVDGPFCCIDPFGNTGNSVIGNVVHAVRQTEVGNKPSQTDLDRFLDGWYKPMPAVTKFKEFVTSGRSFLTSFDKCEYLGSSFTYRVVHPGVETTDERPTDVSWTSHKTVDIFSGKIGTCVTAARQILSDVESM